MPVTKKEYINPLYSSLPSELICGSALYHAGYRWLGKTVKHTPMHGENGNVYTS